MTKMHCGYENDANVGVAVMRERFADAMYCSSSQSDTDAMKYSIPKMYYLLRLLFLKALNKKIIIYLDPEIGLYFFS